MFKIFFIIVVICCIYNTVVSADDITAGDITSQIISSTSDFTVPTGIYELSVSVEDDNSNAISFRLRVQPNDVLPIVIDGSSTSLYNSDGELASANGSSTSGSASLLGIGSDGTGSGQGVSISFYDTCPSGFSDVHSDFDPELLPESSLYNINNVPSLKIDFQLPQYYYAVTASYGEEQCSGNSGNIVTSSDPAGCNTIHKTSVDHQNDCSFSLTDQNDGSFIYQGQLTINAKLKIDLNGYEIVRNVSAPLSWQVKLANEISVTSEITVQENAVCYNDSDCSNSQGCCTDEGTCNCGCVKEGVKTGYGHGAGNICEDDITAPTCDSGCKTHTFPSYHGGSLNAFDRGLYSLPVFSDNSGAAVTVDAIKIDGEVVDDETYAFPIGTTVVTYTVSDVTGNSEDFTYTIIVEDKRAPEVDCHECQSGVAEGSLNVCRGLANGWEAVTLTFAQYETLVSDPSIELRGAVNPSYLPGQDIVNTDTYSGQLAVSAGYLGCNCVKVDQSPSYKTTIITKTWNSWASPTSHDIEDSSRNVFGDEDPDADGYYNVEYHATDVAGNIGYCTKREIIYDITKPECENDFYAAPAIDVANKNYSVDVDYSESIFNPNYGISGVGPAASLDPTRKATDAYYVGTASFKNHTSTYHIEDAAGNKNTCDWLVHVNNPNPCTWPTCEDAPPQVDGCPLSSALVFDCVDNDNCGCGSWTPPTFDDDKFVKKIEVYIDGELHETYDNSNTAHTAPATKLKLGTTKIAYVAYDMHGDKTHDGIWEDDHSNHVAMCNFTVTYEDAVKPKFDTCPSSESINTATANSDYTFSVEYSDDCTLNTNVDVETVNGNEITGEVINKTVTLDIGVHDFKYTITDDSDNTEDCIFTITIVDNVIPTIDCPPNINDRLEQGTTSKIHTFDVTGSDTGANPNPTIKVSPPSGTAFPDGQTLVTAIATDAAGNTNTCSFYVNHEESYPFATFEVALIGADVNEDGSGNYGADLLLSSFVNVYHMADSITSNNGLGLTVTNVEPTNCAEDAAVCQQGWGLRVSFDECKVTDSAYDFTAFVSCTPQDCTESKEFDFTVELDVANFCWQDLESVSITATLDTTSAANHASYMTAYEDNPSTAGFTSVTAFDNGADISGIVLVSSPNVELSNVDITSASRQHYKDTERSEIAGDALDVLQNKVSKATVASFTYTETDVPIESTYYTTYTATVEVTYNLPTGARRRMLLSTDESSESNNVNKIVTAESVSFGTSEVVINPEDAVIVLKLTQCDTSDELKQGLTTVIAQALRIDVSRVNVLVSESTCFIQVSITQLDCDTSDINLVLEQFETAVTDPFHDIHTIMYNNDDISMDITFDYGTFFVSQSPIVQNSQSALFNSNSAAADTTTSLDWYVYVAAGVAIGALVSGYIKSRKN